MRILFLTDNFPPETNAPASRTFEHCREWVRAGHAVTVVTGAPNFPRGKLFPGYRNRLWQTEQVASIRVVRVWTLIAANEGFGWRTLDYLSFMVSAFVASLFLRRVDVVVGTSPQFFTVCAAWAAGALRGVPFVFELRDLWPDSIQAVGALRHPLLLRLLKRIELFLYRRAALVVALTEAFRRDLISRGIEPDRIEVVSNGADLSRFAPGPKDAALAKQLGLSGRFVSGYLGTHGLAHRLDTVLDMARLLEARVPGRHAVLLLGDGADKARLQARAAAEGIGNLVFCDTVPKEEVVRHWSLLDLSLIPLKKDALFATVIPSKLFEAMAMGLPVVLGVEGEARDLLLGAEAGLAVEPENAEALADAVLQLAGNPDLRKRLGRNGRLASARFERNALALRMLALIETCVERRAARPSVAASPIDREPA